MKTRKLVAASILLAALFAGAISATADENFSQTQTTLTNTSFGGGDWVFQAPVSDTNNRWWWDIMAWFGFERR